MAKTDSPEKEGDKTPDDLVQTAGDDGVVSTNNDGTRNLHRPPTKQDQIVAAAVEIYQVRGELDHLVTRMDRALQKLTVGMSAVALERYMAETIEKEFGGE